jgi:hypothetical protein
MKMAKSFFYFLLAEGNRNEFFLSKATMEQTTEKKGSTEITQTNKEKLKFLPF